MQLQRTAMEVFPLFHLFLVMSFTGGALALKIVQVKVPLAALIGHSVQLECIYSLDGDSLYAVKWYRGVDEFYRYVPAEEPRATVFSLNGIEVDLDESNANRLVLRSITAETAGRFRCEVSAEAPSFETVSGHADMTVVQLPQRGPVISGGKPRYSVGDQVDLNCTSMRSSPATNLTWYINGEPAERHHLQVFPIVEDIDGLETSMLGLHFTIKTRHFRKGDLKLKCTATLAALYWQSNEASAEPDRPVHHQRSSSSEVYMDSNSRSTLASAAFTVHFLGQLQRSTLLVSFTLVTLIYFVSLS
ncbi:uncharacterized protein LOC116928466 [Daphnia magna]|uniref:Cell adhesion molecule n=1 Tax=Daphnia magna TaxID=35525 RepID=A0A0P6HFI3_9CRUS|nr:uncharacterized protein LOC116928466 [Daphnia magna]XP_032791447.1 uncharacterized protein LOC116928466 [Daphnia magna]XP_032791448.1 uncharacterized protein LOC116928466 [Daphnia magna]KZS19236.1 Uncharacterized protein APZ42_014388 [Daphnia magna]